MTDSRLDGLVAWYQPIVDLNTGAVSGFEVLSRIVTATGAVESAGPLMEELEREPEVQYALIDRLLSSVRQEIVPVFARHPHFYVSINIPPALLGSGRIGPAVARMGFESWLGRLVVELTERQALTDLGRSAIDAARALGVSVAVDDFGTGHSGLSQFVGLDVDILKIDRSLLLPILANRTAARMLRGVVGLAASLRLRTIAEGVESWEQAFFLRAAGVDCGQGFYWSKAVPGSDVERLVKRGFADRLDRPNDGPAT